MASQALNITTDFKKAISDGDLRITSGFLERYDIFTKSWMLPDQWFLEKTGTEPIDNFGAGHLWDCYYNIYSSGCYSSMERVFGLGEAGEELIKDYYAATSVTDLLQLMFLGFPVIANWSVAMWLLLIWPEEFLPPQKDADYNDLDIVKWLWYKYLSYDQQLVMMWGVMTGASFFGTSLNDDFKEFSMSNWHENTVEMVIEYTVIQLLVFTVPLLTYVGIALAIAYLVIAPLQDAFCDGYNSVYTIEFFDDKNICEIRLTNYFSSDFSSRSRRN